MTFRDLENVIGEILPDASIEIDNMGQIIVYTNRQMNPDPKNDSLVQFEAL